MDNNKKPEHYTGTKGLSLAIVIGAVIGTVLGKLMDNMNTGLMIGLVIGVVGWVLLYNRRPRQESGAEQATEDAQEKHDA